MVSTVQLFVHRDRRPAHRDRHVCQYGRDVRGNGVIRCTVTIRPLPEANGYDFAQEAHYVTKKRPTVKVVEVEGGVYEGQQEWQQGSLMESIGSTYVIEPNRT